MTEKTIRFHTEIVNGICPTCEEYTMLVGLTRQYFRCIVSSEDVSMPKPSPEIFLLASEILNVEPKYCCVIEDTINGVKAGKAAGMNVVAITNTFSIDQLTKSGADLVCQSYTEITKNLPF